MGMAAVVVDIGNGRQIRRQAQSAVDAAALAAVIDYNGNASTQAASTARAIEYVEDNGFLAASTDIQVSFSTNAAGEPCVTVRINNYPVATFFGRVLGATSLPVTAVSMGCQTPSTTSLPGMFSGGQDCSGSGKAFTISGNDNVMIGSIHSNYDAKEGGTRNNLSSGVATYVSTPLDVSGSPPNWWRGATQTSVQPWPVNYALAQFNTGGQYAVAAGSFYSRTAGDRNFSGSVPAGLYYVTGKVKFTSVTIAPRTIGGVTRTGATFVSGGLMELDGDNSLIRPFEDAPTRLTFFAGWQEKSGGERCDSETFKMNGNCNLFDGVLYVPQGKFRFSGEGNGHDYGSGKSCPQGHNTFSGGVIAYAIEGSGNWSVFRGGNVPGGEGNPYLSS
jgi:hypothetical protein